MGFKDKFKEFQTLTVGDDIVLRQVDVENDLEEYFSIYSDTDLFRFYEARVKEGISKESVRVILNNQIKEFNTGRIYSWTIADKKNRALGRILLSDFDANNKIANIGYFLGRDSWGKSIISRCVASVVAFGFSYLELERIYTTVHIENIASWKALEKNGFTREGLLRHQFKAASGLSDCYMYAKLCTD